MKKATTFAAEKAQISIFTAQHNIAKSHTNNHIVIILLALFFMYSYGKSIVQQRIGWKKAKKIHTHTQQTESTSKERKIYPRL